jgi:hypothetical protein
VWLCSFSRRSTIVLLRRLEMRLLEILGELILHDSCDWWCWWFDALLMCHHSAVVFQPGVRDCYWVISQKHISVNHLALHAS